MPSMLSDVVVKISTEADFVLEFLCVFVCDCLHLGKCVCVHEYC